jgi:hypothetical protein
VAKKIQLVLSGAVWSLYKLIHIFWLIFLLCKICPVADSFELSILVVLVCHEGDIGCTIRRFCYLVMGNEERMSLILQSNLGILVKPLGAIRNNSC